MVLKDQRYVVRYSFACYLDCKVATLTPPVADIVMGPSWFLKNSTICRSVLLNILPLFEGLRPKSQVIPFSPSLRPRSRCLRV